MLSLAFFCWLFFWTQLSVAVATVPPYFNGSVSHRSSSHDAVLSDQRSFSPVASARSSSDSSWPLSTHSLPLSTSFQRSSALTRTQPTPYTATSSVYSYRPSASALSASSSDRLPTVAPSVTSKPGLDVQSFSLRTSTASGLSIKDGTSKSFSWSRKLTGLANPSPVISSSSSLKSVQPRPSSTSRTGAFSRVTTQSSNHPPRFGSPSLAGSPSSAGSSLTSSSFFTHSERQAGSSDYGTNLAHFSQGVSFSISGASSSVIASNLVFSGSRTASGSPFDGSRANTALKSKSKSTFTDELTSKVFSAISIDSLAPISQSAIKGASSVRQVQLPTKTSLTHSSAAQSVLSSVSTSAHPSRSSVEASTTGTVSSKFALGTSESRSIPDYTVVQTYTTYCSASTTFTYNRQTVNVTSPVTVTITDCPCTLTRTSSTESWHLVTTPASATISQVRPSPLSTGIGTSETFDSARSSFRSQDVSVFSASLNVGASLRLPRLNTDSESASNVKRFTNAKSVVPSSTYANSPTAYTVVSSYTTYCPMPTTFTYHGQTVNVSTPSTIVITNCPCTLTKISSKGWNLVSEPSTEGNWSLLPTSGSFIATDSSNSRLSGYTSSYTTRSTQGRSKSGVIVSSTYLHESTTSLAKPTSTSVLTGYSTVTGTAPHSNQSSSSVDIPSARINSRVTSPNSISASSTDSSQNTGSVSIDSTSTILVTQSKTVTETAHSYFLTKGSGHPTKTQSTFVLTTTVGAFTTVCSTPTTLAVNSKEYTISSQSTLTIYDCVLTRAAPSSLWQVKTDTVLSALRYSVNTLPRTIDLSISVGDSLLSNISPKTATSNSISTTILEPTQSTISNSRAISARTSTLRGPELFSTRVVSQFVTYCPTPTTFTVNSKVYTITSASDVTITDCPCTIIESEDSKTLSSLVSKDLGSSSTQENDSSTAVMTTGSREFTPTVTSTTMSTGSSGTSTQPRPIPTKPGVETVAGTSTPASLTTVVSSFTTSCSVATTFTINSRTYTGSFGDVLTITDCPCTLTQPLQTDTSVTPPPGMHVSHVTGHTAASRSLPLARSSELEFLVTSLTTFCSTPTTFTVNSKTYTATGPSLFTITGIPVSSTASNSVANSGTVAISTAAQLSGSASSISQTESDAGSTSTVPSVPLGKSSTSGPSFIPPVYDSTTLTLSLPTVAPSNRTVTEGPSSKTSELSSEPTHSEPSSTKLLLLNTDFSATSAVTIKHVSEISPAPSTSTSAILSYSTVSNSDNTFEGNPSTFAIQSVGTSTVGSSVATTQLSGSTPIQPIAQSDKTTVELVTHTTTITTRSISSSSLSIVPVQIGSSTPTVVVGTNFSSNSVGNGSPERCYPSVCVAILIPMLLSLF